MTPKACSFSGERDTVSNMERSKAMKQKVSERFWQSEARTEETKQLIRDIRRNTRHRFTSEEKIRIILEGFRREIPIRDPCRREGIRPNTYYSWLKDFMEAGQERLEHDTARNATRLKIIALTFPSLHANIRRVIAPLAKTCVNPRRLTSSLLLSHKMVPG